MSTSPESAHSTPNLKTRQRKDALDKWATLGACDVCRSRKVKCIRLNDDSDECEACTLRNDKCKTSTDNRPKVKRQDAKAARRKVVTVKQDVVAISHTSPDSGLQRMELSEALMAELLASFFEHSAEQAPYANHNAVQSLFERAGRRLDRVAPALEPFILAMCAAGAQVSDSPLLLGPNAPQLKQLTSVQQTPSLLEFGQRRQALCAQLARRLVDLTDTRGLLRKATIESIAVLTLLPRVLRHPHPWKGLEDVGDTWRPFMAAAFTHVRTLLETPGANVAEVSIVQWPMIMSDAYTSALTGQFLLVNETDLSEFPGLAGLPSITSELTRQLLLSDNIGETIIPLLASAAETVRIGRLIAKTISIPLRKGQAVDLTIFSERIKDLTTHIRTLRGCSRVAEEIYPLVPPAVLEMQKQAFGVYMPTSMIYASVPPTLLMTALHDQFELYTQHHISITLMEELNRSELFKVRRDLESGMIDSIFIVADTIQGLEGKEAVASLTRQTSMLVGIQEQLLKFFQLACEIRTIEQNGCNKKWTYRVKCQTLRLLLDAAHLQSWSWGDREAELTACEFQYTQYLKSTYYQSFTIPSNPSRLPNHPPLDTIVAQSSNPSPSNHSDSTSSISADVLLNDTVVLTGDPQSFMASYTDLWSNAGTPASHYPNGL